MELADSRYVLGRLLGRGGMADVRQATDTVLDRQVAVKLFRDDVEESAAERTRTEMLTLASLNHPGLVAVHDAGTTTDADGHEQPYLVMELVDGPTLASCGVLAPDRAQHVGREVAAALAYVHEKGLVHRDVKPANILLSPAGAKLADFGVVRVLDGARHTGTGLMIGTAPYLAPEQVAGEQVSAATDVYALGLVLLECLKGTREYEGTGVETALARLNRQPVVPATLPAPWPELLTRMTARQPGARPTAAEVATTLGAPHHERAPVSAPTRMVPLRPTPTRALPVPSSRRLPLVGAAACLALVAAVLVGASGSGDPKVLLPHESPSPTRPTLAPASVVLPKPTASPTPTRAPAPAPRHGKGKKNDD